MKLPEGFTYQWAICLPTGELATNGINGNPWLFSERAGAEAMLEQMRNTATQMGMPGWTASIVYSICSPFIAPSDQAAAALVDEISAWLKQQTGGKP